MVKDKFVRITNKISRRFFNMTEEEKLDAGLYYDFWDVCVALDSESVNGKILSHFYKI